MQELYPGCSTDDPFEFLMRIGLSAGKIRDLSNAWIVIAPIIGCDVGDLNKRSVEDQVMGMRPTDLHGHAMVFWRSVPVRANEEQIRAKVVQHILNHGVPDLRPGRNR